MTFSEFYIWVGKNIPKKIEIQTKPDKWTTWSVGSYEVKIAKYHKEEWRIDITTGVPHNPNTKKAISFVEEEGKISYYHQAKFRDFQVFEKHLLSIPKNDVFFPFDNTENVIKTKVTESEMLQIIKETLNDNS